MSTVFLCHSSIDKPFVEKLAKDLRRLGINVWYDRYEIKVGDSILWKIEEGINETDFFAIVFSEQAIGSDWVKKEIEAAWQKQIDLKQKFILPILYRKCELPYILSGEKYADFTKDYDRGFAELGAVFGIKETDIISADNWRKFVSNSESNWKKFCEKEFSLVITKVLKVARKNNISLWVGGSKNKYSFTLSAWRGKENFYASFRMDPRNNYEYMLSTANEINPNNIEKASFDKCVALSAESLIEYISTIINDNMEKHGVPKEKAHHSTMKFLNMEEKTEAIQEFLNHMHWEDLEEEE